jgi:hypothetical protein
MIEKLNYPIGTEAEWQLKLAIDKINEIIDHMEQGKEDKWKIIVWCVDKEGV